MFRRLLRNRKGQGLVEYALLVAGVALAAIVGVSLMGEKTADMISAVAAVLPGADSDDNGPITVGHLIETAKGTNGSISLDLTTIGNGGPRMDQNLGGNTTGNGFAGLVVDPQTGS